MKKPFNKKILIQPTSNARWWQLKYFLCSSQVGEDEPILTHIFQVGWFNHQPVMLCFSTINRRSRIGGIPQLGSSCALFLGGEGRRDWPFLDDFFFWSLLSYKEVGELHFDEHMCRKMAKQIVKKFCVMNGLIKFEAFNLTSIFRDLLKCCFC